MKRSPGGRRLSIGLALTGLGALLAGEASGGIVFDQITGAQPTLTEIFGNAEMADDTTLDFSGGSVLTQASLVVLNVGPRARGHIAVSIYGDGGSGTPFGLPGQRLGQGIALIDLAAGSITAVTKTTVTVVLPDVAVPGQKVWTAWSFVLDGGPSSLVGVAQTAGTAAVGSSEDYMAMRFSPLERFTYRQGGGSVTPPHPYNYQIALTALPAPGGACVIGLGTVLAAARRRRAG